MTDTFPRKSIEIVDEVVQFWADGGPTDPETLIPLSLARLMIHDGILRDRDERKKRDVEIVQGIEKALVKLGRDE